MRDIEFRGFSIQKECWVYGGFLTGIIKVDTKSKELAKIYNDGILEHYILKMNFNEEGYFVMGDSCYPNSIGQFTGLLDRNGNKIFEGDIVRYDTEIGEVFFDGKSACFNVKDFYCQSADYPTMAFHSYIVCEVIGNIYENPELLGEK